MRVVVEGSARRRQDLTNQGQSETGVEYVDRVKVRQSDVMTALFCSIVWLNVCGMAAGGDHAGHRTQRRCLCAWEILD